MQINIFVSYCHDDVKPDDSRLKILINELDSSGLGTYDIAVDYLHPEAAVGASLPSFMKKIDTADAVIILLTPGYKRRVEAKKGTGVYFEYRRILDRLMESEEQNTYGRSFLLIPIIFSGQFDESCPSELTEFAAKDATWLTTIPGKSPPRVRKSVRSRLKHLINEISARISAVATTRAQHYRDNQERLFRNFLFQDSKSRWNKPENLAYLDSVFVKTSTFLRARNREISFLIGRKGSGKSTITHVLPVLSDPRPSRVLRVEFEDLPFQMCFNVLQARPGDASDLRNAFSPLKSFQLCWDVFLHLFYAWSIRDCLSKRTKLYRVLAEAFKHADFDSMGDAEKDVVATEVLFVYAFEELANYVSEIMRRASQEKGLAGTVARFNPTAFRKFALGERAWRYLETVLRAHKNAGEGVLITADGFDVMVGHFAESTSDREAAERFERELLLALFQIVLNGGPVRQAGGVLYEISEYCIAIPHDRFLEVRDTDRDRYQYRHKFAKIAWSGIELSALVRKRLALLREVRDPKGSALEARLQAVMEAGYPELPSELGFRFGGANHRMDLFLYVLRHTFWRPRDILYYYAALLTASEQFKRRGKELPSEFIRQVIAGATRAVIEDEFLDEFAKSFRNLRMVLQRFRHGPQVLGLEEIEKRVGDVKFLTTIPDSLEQTLEWKIELLFDLGVLGVVLDKDAEARFGAFRHAFIFNEDDFLRRKLGRDVYGNFTYALHPVFCEYLHLDTSTNTELILPLNWEYLHRNEVLLGIVPP